MGIKRGKKCKNSGGTRKQDWWPKKILVPLADGRRVGGRRIGEHGKGSGD